MGKIARALVIFATCFIDPCQACLVGCLMLCSHCIQVCCLDILSYLANKIVKPCLHVIYESCIYPFCVCARVTLDACNICLEPCWIIAYRCVTPASKLISSARMCEGTFQK